MTALDLKAVHEALAGQIRKGIATANTWTIKAFPSTAPRPVIEVWPDADYVDPYGRSGPDESTDVQLLIRVFLTAANAESEWKIAAGLLSHGSGHTSSIFNAVNVDPTLGGKVDGTYIAAARWNPEDGTVDIPAAIRIC